MASITIKWEQRVLGRNPGDIEETEVTPMITALLQQGRVSLVTGKVDLTPLAPQYPEPVVYGEVSPEATFDAEVEAEVAKPTRKLKAAEVE